VVSKKSNIFLHARKGKGEGKGGHVRRKEVREGRRGAGMGGTRGKGWKRMGEGRESGKESGGNIKF
jgi:hypothetical protein